MKKRSEREKNNLHARKSRKRAIERKSRKRATERHRHRKWVKAHPELSPEQRDMAIEFLDGKLEDISTLEATTRDVLKKHIIASRRWMNSHTRKTLGILENPPPRTSPRASSNVAQGEPEGRGGKNPLGTTTYENPRGKTPMGTTT